MKKKKIAIFDLTDCEGCELQILNFKEKLFDLAETVDIVNWRLAQSKNRMSDFDIALVEGAPLSEEEQNHLQEIRENSKILVTLGACACTGGIPASINKSHRSKAVKKIYGEGYVPKAIEVKPVKNYVKVDYSIPGCPANPTEIKRVLSALINDIEPEPITYPVCLECKLSGNPCFIERGYPCLGPITRGGCGSICVKNGIHCWGCWGLNKFANTRAMTNTLKKMGLSTDEIKKYYEVFWQEDQKLDRIFKKEER